LPETPFSAYTEAVSPFCGPNVLCVDKIYRMSSLVAYFGLACPACYVASWSLLAINWILVAFLGGHWENGWKIYTVGI